MKTQEEKDNILRGEKRDMAKQLKAMTAKATDRKRRLIQAESKVVDYHRRLADSAATKSSDQSELESLYLDEHEGRQQIRKTDSQNKASGDNDASGSFQVDLRGSKASKYDRKLARGKPDESSQDKYSHQ
ncbi:hypothetical protein N7528_003149 [Penicillium herquei]|nr:hypothetical protein N7528_003149 [Penicillium herquei]